LVDTHVVIRSLIEPKKLSRDQARALELASRRSELVALSSMSLLEIAFLSNGGRLKATLDECFGLLKESPAFQLLPLTYEIASDAAALGNLPDPADRVIVATARVHRLRLLTSDQRILDSRLVATIG
jgi:PIN domain nuclease of toxin-antitoxin system